MSALARPADIVQGDRRVQKSTQTRTHHTAYPVASVQREPELRDHRGAAPARRETFRIGQRVSATPGSGVWIACENETVLPGKIRIVVAQVKMEAIAPESNAGIPIRVGRQGRQGESAQRRRLVAKPEITGARGKRGRYALQDF